MHGSIEIMTDSKTKIRVLETKEIGMKDKVPVFFKVCLFLFSSFMMWGVLYALINTKDGVVTHSILSGVFLVAPVLILNFIGSQIFMQTMRQQDAMVNKPPKT